MTDEQNDTGDVFVANPDDFADDHDDYAPKPGWIKPVGIISIVWAAIGLLLGTLGVAWMFLGPTFLNSANLEGGIPPVMQSVHIPLAAATVVGLLWALFLLISGIMLLVQSPASRRCFLIYAIGGVALTLGSSWLNLD